MMIFDIFQPYECYRNPYLQPESCNPRFFLFNAQVDASTGSSTSLASWSFHQRYGLRHLGSGKGVSFSVSVSQVFIGKVQLFGDFFFGGVGVLHYAVFCWDGKYIYN